MQEQPASRWGCSPAATSRRSSWPGEFSNQPDIIIANQPTRGIDVGAAELVRNKLVELRDAGAAVMLISADLTEVMELSDDIIVLCGGEVVAWFDSAINLML